MVIAAVIVTVLAGIGIGVGAYRAGEDAGITQGIEQVQTAQEVQVVHVVDDGPRGFFPGFFLFPLFLIGGFFLIGAIVRGGRRGHGPWVPGPGPWNDEGRRRFQEGASEWHRREHGEAAPPGTPPAQAAGA